MPGASVAKIGSRCRDDVVLAADHEAEPALEAEDAAGRADVDVVDAALLELGRLRDVVAVVGVPAVDHDVARLHGRRDLVDDRAGDAGGHHHPRGPGRPELRHHVLDRRGGHGPLGLELRDRLRAHVRDDDLVPVAHQPARQVGAHAPQSNHAELHRVSFHLSRR